MSGIEENQPESHKTIPITFRELKRLRTRINMAAMFLINGPDSGHPNPTSTMTCEDFLNRTLELFNEFNERFEIKSNPPVEYEVYDWEWDFEDE